MHQAGVIDNPLALIARLLESWLAWLRRLVPCEWFNIGSGQRPTRREQIRSTILGDEGRTIRWRAVLEVELPWLEGASLVEHAWACLASGGMLTPAEALGRLADVPATPLHCSVTRLLPPSPVAGAEPAPDADGLLRCFVIPDAEFLRRALILGCCGDQFYDPAKPVIWTEKRLARRVRLFQTGGFYDDDENQ